VITLRKVLILLIIALLLAGCDRYEPSAYGGEEITGSEVAALNLAMNDAYKARAFCEKVIKDFGDIAPFTKIIKSENNNIKALEKLFKEYDLEILTDDWSTKTPKFNSIEEACEAGRNVEIENIELYDMLFTIVEKEDMITTFKNLQGASRNNHLPAFETCLAGYQ